MSPLHDLDTALRGGRYEHQCCCTPTTRCIAASSTDAEGTSHNIKPGRRRIGSVCYNTPSTTFFLILLVLATLCGISEAGINPVGYRNSRELAELARRGTILIDTRPEPIPRLWQRQEIDVVETTSAPTPSSTAAPPHSSTGSASSAATSTVQSSSPSSTSMVPQSAPTTYPLPKPFDTSLSTNFSSSTCPDFFNSFLQNETFIDCLPLSLLLQNSNSFFLAEKSVTRITQTLDATCKVDFGTCSAVMSDLANELRWDDNCGYDYDDENALVLQAYNGLIAYQPLYQAGCLKDSEGNYCFADAITNMTSPSDSYVYFLPLGIALPGASQPTCSSCLQQTMQIFASAASNLSEPVSADYSSAALQIDVGCGPNWVNSSVTPIKGSAPNHNGVGALSASSLTSWFAAVVVGFLIVWS